MEGVIRTRVGYAGGDQDNPTYHSLGNHTETIQIDFDPEIVSYEELLDIFWNSHNPWARPFSQQYKSMILFHNQDQERLAIQTKKAIEEQTGDAVYTDILPVGEFFLAETYHQKYLLQSRLNVMGLLAGKFATNEEFINSTLTARLNGYFGGHLNLEELERELQGLDLTAEEQTELLKLISGSN